MKRPRAPNNTAAVLIAVLTCVLGAISAIAYKRDGDPAAPVSDSAATRGDDEKRANRAPDVDDARPAKRDSRATGRSRAERFDFYLMAMTVHDAWCEDGNGRKAECRLGSDRPLVIHGLWPERLEPRTYPRDCAGPRLELEPRTESELRTLMPGMRSGLHVHEWREHGTCSGLDDDDYFRATLALARDLDAALGPTLTTHAHRVIEAADLRDAADRYRPGLGRTFTLHCRTLRDAKSERPYLIEVRQCVDDDGADGAPGTPLDCATVKRRDQGCGGAFGIAMRNSR